MKPCLSREKGNASIPSRGHIDLVFFNKIDNVHYPDHNPLGANRLIADMKNLTLPRLSSKSELHYVA